MSTKLLNLLYLLLVLVNVGVFITSIVLQDLHITCIPCIALMCVLFVLILLLSNSFKIKQVICQVSLIVLSLFYKGAAEYSIYKAGEYMIYLLYVLATVIYIYAMLFMRTEE